jgi:UDP-sulfoquinovose synthase
MDENLINRFDYDGDYGTVLNRFLMQSAVGHPLTVYGIGGQTRAFINIQDTVNCIKLAIATPPKLGDRVRILNQCTETHTVKDLAQQISKMTGADIRFYSNPRNEDLSNKLSMSNAQLIKMGLKPITLSEGLMKEIYEVAEKYKSRCDLSKIICTSKWTNDIVIDETGTEMP